MAKSELNESTVIIAAQRPALFMYVPMTVFVVEVMVLMVIYAFFGWWTVTLLPIHIWFIAQTNADFQWPIKLWCSITLFLQARNLGVRKKGVVTFTPNRIGQQTLNHEHHF